MNGGFAFDLSDWVAALPAYVGDAVSSIGPVLLIPAGLILAVGLGGIFLSFLGRVRSAGAHR